MNRPKQFPRYFDSSEQFFKLFRMTATENATQTNVLFQCDYGLSEEIKITRRGLSQMLYHSTSYLTQEYWDKSVADFERPLLRSSQAFSIIRLLVKHLSDLYPAIGRLEQSASYKAASSTEQGTALAECFQKIIQQHHQLDEDISLAVATLCLVVLFPLMEASEVETMDVLQTELIKSYDS